MTGTDGSAHSSGHAHSHGGRRRDGAAQHGEAGAAGAGAGAASPRRTGKLHYHEEEVRPIEAARLIHRQPHSDLYADPDRNHPGRDVDLPLRTIQIHIGCLEPGQATRLHKHHNEAAIYIIEGTGHSEVQGQRLSWSPGDFVCVPSMQWHTHVNSGDSRVLYMGITNKRMLDWLGLDRKVEAGRHVPMEEVLREIESGIFSPYSHYRITPAEGVRFGPEGFITHSD